MKTIALSLLSLVLFAALVIVLLIRPQIFPGQVIGQNETTQIEKTAVLESLSQPIREGNKIQAGCKLVPEHSSQLSFNASGLLESLLISEGQMVEAGAVLSRLDGQKQAEAALIVAQNELTNANQALQKLKDEIYLDAARALKILRDARMNEKNARNALNRLRDAGKNQEEIDQAEAVLNLARAEVQQAEILYEKNKNGPNPEILASDEARVKAANYQVDAAQETLAGRLLLAPFSGTIVEVYLEPGDFVGPGMPVLLLADLTKFIVETTDITELNITKIYKDLPAEVIFDSFPKQIFNGSVQTIQPYGKPVQGDILYTVYIDGDFSDQGLLWGMTCSALIGE